MSEFWVSEVGALSGLPEDSFTRVFKVIPDGSTAIAKINKFHLNTSKPPQYFEIDWEITVGDFKGQHVFQKIKAFDPKPHTRHKALNMMMLLFKMFGLKPASDAAPSDIELKQFVGKHAGIRIQEWATERDNGSLMEGNYISEVHPAANFKCEVGKKMEVNVTVDPLDSAFKRNGSAQTQAQLMDKDVPW